MQRNIEVSSTLLNTGQPVCSVHWHRVPAERLFIGKPASSVLPLVPLLFSLCGKAQSLAAMLVLDQAILADMLAEVRLEAIRETVFRFSVDWPKLRGFIPANLAEFRTFSELTDWKTWCEQHWFGMPVHEWAGLGEAGWLSWIQSGATPIANDARCLFGQVMPIPKLWPWQSAAHLVEAINPSLWTATTLPAGLDASALSIEQREVHGLLHEGRIPLARWLSRMVRLARMLTLTEPHASVARLERDGQPPINVAMVETARGYLLHLAASNEAGVVETYQVIPPTAWHAHPEGVIYNAVMSCLLGNAFDWQQQVTLIDPCTGFELATPPKNSAGTMEERQIHA
ncbi:hypothetical protein LIN78_02305 [Leeia sp. TBRC 13508]|uniref:Uncharacterized protein n=1 Tax=Leeia speluncae TaxID=2884804 RepID=A0ABS8D2F9_9NEIS|nr:hypothetical protein [Leeia speluncae]MCB6182386.1 hypothetical protein [Leeia speluncae]